MYSYNGTVVEASSKEEAVRRIVAGGQRWQECLRQYCDRNYRLDGYNFTNITDITSEDRKLAKEIASYVKSHDSEKYARRIPRKNRFVFGTFKGVEVGVISSFAPTDRCEAYISGLHVWYTGKQDDFYNLTAHVVNLMYYEENGFPEEEKMWEVSYYETDEDGYCGDLRKTTLFADTYSDALSKAHKIDNLYQIDDICEVSRSTASAGSVGRVAKASAEKTSTFGNVTFTYSAGDVVEAIRSMGWSTGYRYVFTDLLGFDKETVEEAYRKEYREHKARTYADAIVNAIGEDKVAEAVGSVMSSGGAKLDELLKQTVWWIRPYSEAKDRMYETRARELAREYEGKGFKVRVFGNGKRWAVLAAKKTDTEDTKYTATGIADSEVSSYSDHLSRNFIGCESVLTVISEGRCEGINYGEFSKNVDSLSREVGALRMSDMREATEAEANDPSIAWNRAGAGKYSRFAINEKLRLWRPLTADEFYHGGVRTHSSAVRSASAETGHVPEHQLSVDSFLNAPYSGGKYGGYRTLKWCRLSPDEERLYGEIMAYCKSHDSEELGSKPKPRSFVSGRFNGVDVRIRSKYINPNASHVEAVVGGYKLVDVCNDYDRFVEGITHLITLISEGGKATAAASSPFKGTYSNKGPYVIENRRTLERITPSGSFGGQGVEPMRFSSLDEASEALLELFGEDRGWKDRWRIVRAAPSSGTKK